MDHHYFTFYPAILLVRGGDRCFGPRGEPRRLPRDWIIGTKAIAHPGRVGGADTVYTQYLGPKIQLIWSPGLVIDPIYKAFSSCIMSESSNIVGLKECEDQ